MAISVLERTSATAGGNVTSLAVDLPSTVNDGDLLVAIIGTNQTQANGFSYTVNWTEVASDLTTGAYNATAIVAKIGSTSDSGGSLTFSWTSKNSRASAVVYRISGHNVQSISDIEYVFKESAGAPTCDLDSISPTWGSAESLFIITDTIADEGELVTSWPTGYSTNGLQIKDDGGVNDSVNLATSYRIVETSTEDPTTITLAGSESQSMWLIAVEPAPAGSSVTLSSPTATVTGSTTATVGCTVTYN